jgi:ABC-type microcin C transport system duplicated ATPase subunit YejF
MLRINPENNNIGLSEKAQNTYDRLYIVKKTRRKILVKALNEFVRKKKTPRLLSQKQSAYNHYLSDLLDANAKKWSKKSIEQLFENNYIDNLYPKKQKVK